MFFRILKKDLKRKKTMNVVMLLFIVLSSMFASTAVNNISAVTGGIEHFKKLSNMSDAYVYLDKSVDDDDFYEKLKSIKGVNTVKTVHYLTYVQAENFKLHGKKLSNTVNPGLIVSSDEMAINYFDKNNNIIKNVEKGTFYCTSSFIYGLDVKEGDEFKLKIGNTKLSLKYAGTYKNYTDPSDNAANPYLIVNDEDYKILEKEPETSIFGNTVYYVYTSDIEILQKAFESNNNVSVYLPEDFEGNYIYDMLIAYMLMILSIILIFIAFLILRFTINFTIEEEFREIGIMKAIGIKSFDVRLLYIVKYIAVTIIGSILGFFVSIPLSRNMLKSISAHIVFSANNVYIYGILTTIGVIIIVTLLCYFSTKKIKKLSPLDAVRDGQTGERFKKKGLLHLASTKIPTTPYLAINDIISYPKRYILVSVILTFLLVATTLTSVLNTSLSSKEMFKGVYMDPDADAVIFDMNVLSPIFTENDGYKTLLKNGEKLCKENNIPAKVGTAYGSKGFIYNGDEEIDLLLTSHANIDINKIYFIEGSAPKAKNEIALTKKVLKEINASIGDTITTNINGSDTKMLITGITCSFMNNGYSGLLSEKYSFDAKTVNNSLGLNLFFTDNPNEKTSQEYIEKIKDVFGTEKVYSAEEYIAFMTGMSDILNTMKIMMIIITLIVSTLVVVLMERSFISREKSEIALIKAIGVTNISIVLWQSLRFTIISLVSSIMSSIIIFPLGTYLLNLGCNLFGDVSNIKLSIDITEVFIICPLFLVLIVTMAALITSSYVKSIKASDTASIE